jgi:hypothetical protein
MKKEFVLMKLQNLFLTLGNTPEGDHVRYIHSQLRNDKIAPSEAMEQVEKLMNN